MRVLLAIGMWVGVCGLTEAGGGSLIKKEEVPKYIGLLRNSASAAVRANAADELGRRGAVRITDVENAIEPLMASLKSDKDSVVRKAAARALGDIAPKPRETVPALAEALRADKALDVRLAVVEALAKFGPEAQSALPALREFAKEQGDNKKTKQQIAAAIKTISGGKKK